MKTEIKLVTYFTLLIGLMAFFACDKGEDISTNPIGNNIFYKVDGRTIDAGSPLQIEIDINNDQILDFLTFSALTSDQNGDHLYFGIKPIDSNMIKSGLPNDNYYLNLGLIVGEEYKKTINNEVANNQTWTSSRNFLVIKHTENNGNSWCEGSLKNENEIYIGVKHVVNQKEHYGWLKLQFNRTLERVTLIEYAYNLDNNTPIKAGQKE
ncbi:hypothetical protein ACFSKN_09745 [Mariniflexile gromovii]|uniref:NigD-like protein n=1 Tax=Mariniflexile gromovii TaxID=362523 RepID=A0ABS4BWT0_9FLAO|nr:hypothetical protein [Mariniflexile gromovii]MBP0905049.1 hypothetical protein [Mariniflexile gromovii]